MHRINVSLRAEETEPRPGFRPVALAVRKPGRGTAGDGWCVVAKIVPLAGRPTLAVAWRNQKGTEKAISLPTAVLDYAACAGCNTFILRDDRRRLAWTCELATFGRGSLRSDGERYVPLTWLTAAPWQAWPFASEVVRLAEPQPAAEQLGLGV